MIDQDYARLRKRLLRDGDIADELYSELRDIVAGVVRRRELPPVFAPYGEWNEEAIDEVFQAWMTRRLLGLGHLKPLIARAGDVRVFRARAARSLRQFLLNERDRTQAANLFARMRTLLNEDGDFSCFIDAKRSQDRWWGLTTWDDPEPFSASERTLHAAAWAAGDLVVIRYRADAKKLSPVLDLPELKRFAVVVFETLTTLLTVPLLIDALRARLDLDEGDVLPLGDSDAATTSPTAMPDQLGLRELAELARSELTERQALVLRATAGERPLADIGRELHCSAATVLNEQRRVAALLTRLTADDAERAELLNLVVDLLYEMSDRDG